MMNGMNNVNEIKAQATMEWTFSSVENFMSALKEVKEILNKFGINMNQDRNEIMEEIESRFSDYSEWVDGRYLTVPTEVIGLEEYSEHQFSFGLIADILGCAECTANELLEHFTK